MNTVPLVDNLLPLREEPGRVPLAVSLRNALFDPLFYDTNNLTLEEKSRLLQHASQFEEGGMLFVCPERDAAPIEYFSLSHDLIEKHPELDTVTIPGVGSSLVGTASLARQVANATGRPAVGIIAGYGAADLISEALGGWFVFGTRNRISSLIAEWKREVKPKTRSSDFATREKYKVKSTTFLVDEPESNTLLNIMLRHARNLRLIVGHSKGSLNIQNALSAFVEETEFEVDDYQNIGIVTLGCGVAMPTVFKNVHQYLGSWDLLGNLNTPGAERNDPTLRRVDAKGHNLCSWNPWHMPVDKLLHDAAMGQPRA